MPVKKYVFQLRSKHQLLKRNMIDLKRIRPSNNRYVDGELEDGRFVEFKANIPRHFDNLVKNIVAMANTVGGLIIFGVDERTLSVVGIHNDYQQLIMNLELAIKRLSIGVTYLITHEVVHDRNVVILEINKAESTTYFSRVETSPARQNAYRYMEEVEGGFSLVNEEMRYNKVFKYMTLDTFISSLYRGTWRFFEPSKWKDKYEQRFYCAKYTFPAALGNTPQLFATCVTRVQNSEAAWKVYSNGQGLGAHCLQLELDIVELRKQIRASGLQFEEKPIIYETERIIMDLHKKRNQNYNKYFSSFTLDSFLNLLSLKRDAFTYEKELRLFLIPKNGGKRNKCKKAQFHDINIKWGDVITKVRVDKKCSDAELVSIKRECNFEGIDSVIKNYSFIGKIKPHALKGIKDIEFELFDIDEMPGPSSITIA